MPNGLSTDADEQNVRDADEELSSEAMQDSIYDYGGGAWDEEQSATSSSHACASATATDKEGSVSASTDKEAVDMQRLMQLLQSVQQARDAAEPDRIQPAAPAPTRGRNESVGEQEARSRTKSWQRRANEKSEEAVDSGDMDAAPVQHKRPLRLQ